MAPGKHLFVMRIIIQNLDNVPDDIIGGVISLGLPEKGLCTYKTRVGEVAVAVVDGRKSRVYQFWRPYNEEVIVNAFTARD